MSVLAGVLLAAAGSALAVPRDVTTHQVLSARAAPDEAFEQWVRRHGKAYAGGKDEYERRREIWKDNLEYVHSYNAQHSTHWLGMNSHADMTQQEHAATRLGFDAAAARPRRLGATWRYAGVDSHKLPKSIDWRDHGAVSHVKNQEQCGSCWAFSTTGAIEGINAIYTGHMEVLSEQELLDCDTKHDHGCEGGLMDTAFEWVVKNHGIDTERDYKYHAEEGVCSVNRRKRDVVTIDSYDDVPSKSQAALKKAVAHQPIATAIEADERNFQLYAGGVLTAECGTDLDHGVLIAGYGRENHTDYWLIKNSWGPEWGDEGYIKLARGDEDGPGQCGLAIQPSFPIKEHDNPPRPPKPAPDPPPPAPAPGPGPGPAPEPVVCDATTECFPDTTCCCMQEVMQTCLQWACCPIPRATCCDDHIHCCPHDLPVCDVEHGRCKAKERDWTLGGEALAELESGPMYEKVPAQRSFRRGQITEA